MRVLLLFGGRSGEHEVSVASARSISDALNELGHTTISVGITLDGRWVKWDPHSSDRVLGTDPYRFSIDPSARRGFDVIFPALHGPYGEDGALQGLFELADVPYVGTGVEGSAIGLNKWVHRQLFAGAGLPVVPTLNFGREAWFAEPDRWTRQIADELRFPCFTKPVHLGSSVGISRVGSAADLGEAMERAFRHDDVALVEAFGGPREIEVGVLDGAPPLVSLPGEAVPKGEFYDYDSKYAEGGTELRIPADVPSSVMRRISELAVRAFGTARAEGFARVDLFWDPVKDSLTVNEINTIPGMTRTSMFPKVWEASGRSFAEVVDHLLHHAIARRDRKHALEESRRRAHDGEVEVG